MRLGDLIDDYCPRCKLLLNHNVASFQDNQVAKVICRTCFTEHPYLHGKAAAKKTPKARMSAFDQVLAKVSPPSPDAKAGDRPKKGISHPARYISRHGRRPPRD